MEKEHLRKLISQINRYELIELFEDVEHFKKFISTLSTIQINNLLAMDIDFSAVKNFKHLLINNDLLNCKDYKERVLAISTLKNGDGSWHLFDVLCKPNFFNSKSFYKDIEMLSKADTARYGLWILGNDSFINSPYHDEDLKLVALTHDINQKNPLDFVVSDALATVAGNADSIESPYHQEDMKLISLCGSGCLQMSHFYPKKGLNNLAIDFVSLADKYHLENMQILATKPIASEFLYIIMTDAKFTNGKNYRLEVEALLRAKSKRTARALYYYIVNPKDMYDRSYLDDFDMDDMWIFDRVAGNNDSDYLQNLFEINKIDDKFVMYYVALLMNPDFINSAYKKYDLELLKTVVDKSIFMDLYRLMEDKNSLNSVYHKTDALIISQTRLDDVRRLLLEKAINKFSLDSVNHSYDMEYISKLNLEYITEDIYNEMYYYLFEHKGINDLQHREKLEKLLQGKLVERYDLSSYLDLLQANDLPQTGLSEIDVNFKQRSKILNLFKKKR